VSVRTPLLGLDSAELERLVADAGEKPFRAKQLREWIHHHRVERVAEMTNLPQGFRERLAATAALRTLAEEEHLVSADALTEKWLLRVPAASGGRGLTETVLIREKTHSRRTACVSSAVGCALGCVFCATGQAGFERHLEAHEMLEQAYRADAACLGEGPNPQRGLSHVVFMGMGEPLLNLDAVLDAARTLLDPVGLGLSGRHVTISTVGVVPGIRRLAAAGTNLRLALSLHAPNQALREELLPAAAEWPLDDLLPALHDYAGDASRMLTVEYCLIHGVNDSLPRAEELLRLLEGLPCKINLIPLNPTPAYPGQPSPPARIRAFQDALEAGGRTVTLRQEKGQDIDAACGQLRAARRYG
jgi:23S rRNA (adenine2503-C2)-methyltransferase